MSYFKITDILLTTFPRDNRTVIARHVPSGIECKCFKYRAQVRNKMSCIREIEAKLVVVGFFEKIITEFNLIEIMKNDQELGLYK